MPGTDLAGVNRVVAEVFLAKLPALVADLAVLLDAPGVEFHLDLRIRRDNVERARQVFDEEPARFVNRIDELIIAVALAGQGCSIVSS